MILLFFKLTPSFIHFVWCEYVYGCTLPCMTVEDRGQFLGASSLLPSGFWELNLEHWAWRQVTFPVEPYQ